MEKTEAVRQSVGCADAIESVIKYKEWLALKLTVEEKISSNLYGCSHGNGSMPPPDLSWTQGTIGFQPYKQSTGWSRVLCSNRGEGNKRRYLHSFNVCIGRSEETGEPWLAPGNSIVIELYVFDDTGRRSTVFRDTILTVPEDESESATIIGPFNYNMEDIFYFPESTNGNNEYILQAMIDGPNTEQQLDVCFLGNNTGYWATEAVPPMAVSAT